MRVYSLLFMMLFALSIGANAQVKFFSSQRYVRFGYQLSGNFHLKRFYLLAIDIGEELYLCVGRRRAN